MEEERFSRVKHDNRFPETAIHRCLEIASCAPADLDYIVFYEKPFLKFERLLETYADWAPRGFRSYFKAVPSWMKEKLWIKDLLRRRLDSQAPILFAEHHESHAASAFYPSPFESAAILSADGVGEATTTVLGRGEGSQLELLQEIRFPHSLGLLYSAFTYYCGFKVNSGEYKLMGLAPYGTPRFESLILERLLDLHPDGSFQLHRSFFNYEVGLTMISRKFEELFDAPARSPDEPLTDHFKDVAASIQKVTEEALLRTARYLQRKTGEKRLCMAGGVALNCVANGRILRETDFEEIWIQPAAGDSGGAIGAAMAVWHRYLQQERTPSNESADSQKASLLGSAYDAPQIQEFLQQEGATYDQLTLDQVVLQAVDALAEGKVVGWFQDRMEFGPRALGNRSILADPRRSEALQEVNLRIKFLESFRPFAPAVLAEEAHRYFELACPSPYMLLTAQVRPEMRTRIPAVTHVDGSARVQTVHREQHPTFHALLTAFFRKTGCPVLLNTSFNVRGEPIVESPADAYQTFMRSGIDFLALGSFVLIKARQPTGMET
jgi:carbamoyltransferase